MLRPTALFLACLAGGCAVVPTTEESGASESRITSDDVIVLNAEESDSADVKEQQITFTNLASATEQRFVPGSLIVGRRARTTSSGYGFLRRVVNVSHDDGRVIVSTSAARLTDAVNEGSALVTSDALDPYAPQLQGATPKIRTQAVGDTADGARRHYEHSFDPQPIFTNDNLTVQLDSTKTTCSPKFDTALDIRGARLSQLRFVADDIMTIEASVSATAHAEFSRQVTFPLFRNRIPLPPLWIGPVPVEETVDIAVDLSCDLSASGSMTARAGVKVELAYKFGVDYTNGQWHVVAESNEPTLSPIGPSFEATGTARMDCSVVPRVALLFYDVVGPYLSVSPRLVATANAQQAGLGTTPSVNWSLVGSVHADAGLTGTINVPGAPRLSELFNNGIASAQFNLYNAEKRWDGTLGGLPDAP